MKMEIGEGDSVKARNSSKIKRLQSESIFADRFNCPNSEQAKKMSVYVQNGVALL